MALESIKTTCQQGNPQLQGLKKGFGDLVKVSVWSLHTTLLNPKLNWLFFSDYFGQPSFFSCCLDWHSLGTPPHN
jgi:hypothetical protein